MKKKTKIKLAAAAFPAALALVTQYPTSITKVEQTHDYSVVLGDIPHITEANPLLSELMWFGSHDCFSDKINYFSDMDPVEVKNKEIYANPLIRTFGRGISARFSKTQNIGAAQQLYAGARFFDIRLTRYKGDYYTRHSLISDRFEPYLRDILRFLNDPAHKGEVVMLFVQYAVFDDGKDYSHLFRWLDGIREGGKNIFDFIPYETLKEGKSEHEKLTGLRYNEATKNGTQAGAVLILPENEVKNDFGYNKFYSVNNSVVAPWANRITDKDIREFYENQEREARAYSESGEKDKFYIMQAQKTPRLYSAREIAWSLYFVSILDLARDSNAKLVKDGILDRWFTGDFQVLLIDNINSRKEDFNTAINYKIRMFNTNKIAEALDSEYSVC